MTDHIVIGIDEVGRGPLAGPLVVAAVALDMNREYNDYIDSKKLSKIHREMLAVNVKQSALGIGMGWIDAPTIDKLGMTDSLKKAAKMAYDQLPADIRERAECIVIDGNIEMLDDPRAITLVKADAKVQAVSAASIVAKVARDHYMYQLDDLFPSYGFLNHVGYGTVNHMNILEKLGPIKGIHRASFAPVRRLIESGDEAEAKTQSKAKIDNTIGRIAEGVAADYLTRQGYKIVARNWRNKFCEIDIIAQKDGATYFVEVKYRKNNRHGDGIAAITPKKLEQMKFAAQIYIVDTITDSKEIWNFPYEFMAISLHGRPPVVDNVVAIT